MLIADYVGYLSYICIMLPSNGSAWAFKMGQFFKYCWVMYAAYRTDTTVCYWLTQYIHDLPFVIAVRSASVCIPAICSHMAR